MYKILSKNLSKLPKRQFQCACLSSAKDSNKSAPDSADSDSSPTPNLPPEKVPKYDEKATTKDSLRWRTPWHQKEADHYVGLRSFYSDDSQVDLLKLLQTPINFRPSAIKAWWTKRQEYKDMMMQSYLPERHQTVGSELAAAYFVVHRGGAVKFFGENKWTKANKFNEYDLPRFYDSDKILQAIDCSDMNLWYEGLANFRDLQNVEWLSFNGVDRFDDWFLDKISNVFSHSLLYLDIRKCPKYTERGLGALYKMEKLKILCIDDMLMTSKFEMTCLMLQEVNPDLDIRIGD